MKPKLLKILSIALFTIGILIWGFIVTSKVTNKNESLVKTGPSIVNNPIEVVQKEMTQEQEVESGVVIPSPITDDPRLATSAAAPKSITGTSSPKTLTISKIGLNAQVESVGLDQAGRMAVPGNWFNVGWYNKGYKIGDGGSAVIAGHYDTVGGGPAAFYRLGNLVVGDLITVTDEGGKKYNFRVTGKTSYPWNQLPLTAIFGTPGPATLNLITCSGAWDRNSRNYTQRMVVYSKLEGVN